MHLLHVCKTHTTTNLQLTQQNVAAQKDTSPECEMHNFIRQRFIVEPHRSDMELVYHLFNHQTAVLSHLRCGRVF